MSEKITFRIDKDVKQQLGGEDVNLSGVMRTLAENYAYTGDAVEVALQKQLKDKENELEGKRLEKTRVENEIEKLEREVRQIEDKIKERRESIPEEVREFAKKIETGNFKRDMLSADNPATQNWAQKAGLETNRFVRKVEQVLDG